MPIQVNCPACARPLRVPDNLIGQRVKCPGCLDQFIAAPSTPAAAAPTEEFRAAEERPARPRLDHDEDRRELEGYRPADEPTRPARPARMPRFSDYEEDDDDFDDLPRRRRRRGPNREWAMSKVSGPATGLMVVGIIGIIVSVLSFGAGIVNLTGPGGGGGRGGAGAPPGGAAFMAGNAVGNVVGAAIHLGVSILVITGAQKMKNLEGYGLAKAAAIIAIIPCISPCCILGIIFGIQALNVLNESEVREAFGA